MRAFRKRLVVYGIWLLALWLLSSFVVAYALTRRRGPQSDEPLVEVAWGTLQDVRVSTADGENLGAWWLAGKDDQPIVILLHGLGARRSWSLEPAAFFSEQHCGLLLLTLRGHGDSTGDTVDFGYSSRHDLVAAVDWIEKHHPGRPIVVWGTSLGAATGLFAAGELGPRVAGYWLECAFQDLPTATRNRTRLWLPAGIEWIAYQGLNLMAPLVLPELDQIAPAKAAAEFPKGVSATVAAGALDPLAPPCESCAIAERIGPAAKFVIFEKGPHSTLHRAEPDRYRAEIADLLDRVRSASNH